jgi:hypothetical protein
MIHRIIPAANCKVIALSVFPQITNHSLQLKGNNPFKENTMHVFSFFRKNKVEYYTL